MASGIRPFIMSMIAVIVFALFIILAAVSWIGQTNPNSPILNNTYGLNNSANTLTNSLNSFQNTTNFAAVKLSGEQPSPAQYIFLIFQGAFVIPLVFLSLMTSAAFTLPQILISQLGIFGLLISVALGVISVGIVITVVFLLIKNLRTGESESY